MPQMSSPPPLGTAVRLRGLQSRPDLNGSIGIVNGFPSEGRFPVVLHIDGQLQEAYLKLQSLEPSDSRPSWYIPPQCLCRRVHIRGNDDECVPCDPIAADCGLVPATQAQQTVDAVSTMESMRGQQQQAAVPSFIQSSFTTRVEYEAWRRSLGEADSRA